MSADNYIFISRRTFVAVERCASDGRVIAKLGKGKNLDEAIDIAQDRMEGYPVEYGIVFGKK